MTSFPRDMQPSAFFSINLQGHHLGNSHHQGTITPTNNSAIPYLILHYKPHDGDLSRPSAGHSHSDIPLPGACGLPELMYNMLLSSPAIHTLRVQLLEPPDADQIPCAQPPCRPSRRSALAATLQAPADAVTSVHLGAKHARLPGTCRRASRELTSRSTEFSPRTACPGGQTDEEHMARGDGDGT